MPGDSARGLVVVSGALEPPVMANEALPVVGRVAGTAAKLDTTCGRFDEGTAPLSPSLCSPLVA